MSDYYYDTEFLEGTQTKRFLGIPFGKTKPTIDLISIGIVSEDGREYYAISKDFNLKEAWNRFDLKDDFSVGARIGALPPKKKVYWIRENVLKPIYYEWIGKDINFHEVEFSYNDFKRLLKKYGKPNKQIASEIVEFVYGKEDDNLTGLSQLETAKKYEFNDKSKNPIFHAYYGAYDHVAFCWLFGKMIDLPKGFPMYSIDLKQMLDEIASYRMNADKSNNIEDYLDEIKEHPDYPKQENAHNALDDAKWNKNLHEFIKSQL